MKSKLRVIVFGLVFAVFTAVNWCFPDSEYSLSERRYLKELPAFSASSFVSDFETYVSDQFPFRDMFRGLKALSNRYVFLRRETNGYFKEGAYLSKLDFPLNKEMADHFKEVIDGVSDRFKDSRIMYVVVPDKNSYLDVPAVSVAEVYDYLGYEGLDIADLLELSDYYYGDSHWRNECLEDVATRILDGFGVKSSTEYELRSLDVEFNGVFKGQSALSCGDDRINYLYASFFDDCVVKDYQGKELGLFDFKKAYGKDAYEFFLGGVQPYVEIENPGVDNGRELVVFRDSFGSSLVPLLLEGYSRVRVFDLRYMNSGLIDEFMEIEDQDVLFLYSLTVINSSLALK